MTISVVCPHCEETFQLQPDMAGKTIRCPSFDCREPFEVKAKQDPVRPSILSEIPSQKVDPAPVEEPVSKAPSKKISDFVPILNVESTQPKEVPYEKIESANTPWQKTDSAKTDPAPEVNDFQFEQISSSSPVKEPNNQSNIPVAKRLPKPDKASLPVARLIKPDEPKVVEYRPDDGNDFAFPSPTPSNDGPKEVQWSESLESELAEKDNPNAIIPEGGNSLLDDPILRRKRSRSWPQFILISLISLTVLSVISAGAWMLFVKRETETTIAKDAKEAYDSLRYSEAYNLYSKLIKDYPGSSEVGRYQLHRAIAQARTATTSTTAKETPEPGLQAFQELVKEFSQHPLVKSDNFGSDIYETGRQVIDNLAANAEQKNKEFVDDRKVMKPLEKSEEVVETAFKLFPTMQPFRAKESAPLDSSRAALDKVLNMNAFERKRLKLLQPYRNLTEEPTDDRIEEFEKMLKRESIDKDTEALKLAADAKTKLRELIVPTAVSIPAKTNAPVGDISATMTVDVEHIIQPNENIKPEGEPVFAVSRGILYAFESELGRPLWNCRLGNSNDIFDRPVQATLGEGGTEVVILATNHNKQYGLTMRNAAKGDSIWHQSLEAAVAGRPVVVKDRVFAPLKDDKGTVAEFDLLTGERVGQITIRQPIGTGATHLQGSGLLYVAAAARRIFVLDIAAKDQDGRRLPPKCVQILATDHIQDGLLTEPIAIGPPGRTAEKRFLVITQKVDPNTMKLRCYTMPDVVANQVLEDKGRENGFKIEAELTLPGWCSFAPTTDGERVTCVTDSGHFAIFGVNQKGNIDKTMYSMNQPSQEANKIATTPRGQIISVDEDNIWSIIDGQLIRLRSSVNNSQGLKLNYAGTPFEVGEPLHRASQTSQLDTSIIAIRNRATFGSRIIAFDPRDGRIKWQRSLGGNSSLARLKDGSIIGIDDDGGVAALASNSINWATTSFASVKPIGKSWAISNLEETAAWAVTPEMIDQKYFIRVCKSTTQKSEKWTLASEDAKLKISETQFGFAGAPLACAGGFLIPLNDGQIYRFVEKTGKLMPGPSWRHATAKPDSICYLAQSPIKPDDFFTTDGNNKINRWTWTSGENDPWKVAIREAWESPDPFTIAPLAVADGDREFLVVPDSQGAGVYPGAAPGEIIHRWKDFKPVRDFIRGQGNKVIVQAEKLIAFDIQAEKPAWEWSLPANTQLVGVTLLGKTLYATNFYGQITTINAESGKEIAITAPSRSDLVARENNPALPMANGKIILPLDDGTAVLLLQNEQ